MRVLPVDQVILTLSYADIFDFPLTIEELHYWKIASPFRFHVKRNRAYIQTKQQDSLYLTLPRRSHLIKTRKAKEQFVGHKWDIAYSVGRLFRFIPSVTLVGVTGGLACHNANKNDDIDLFFITKPGTLWISRLFVIMVCDIWGKRRKFGMREAKDAICLNMFMAQDALSLPKKDHDLFAAHEVLQMHPIWERGGAYGQFLWANRWVAYFLPTAWRDKSKERKHKNIPEGWARESILLFFRIFEPLAKYLQLWYMRNHRTNEIIDRGMLRFHPQDARDWIRAKYENRLKRYNIPLDKIFYRS